MKICLVSPYDYSHSGGVTDHVKHLADELRERGHRVVVMAPSSALEDINNIPDYVRIGRSVPIRVNGSVARIALSFHLVRRVRQLLDGEKFDVVHYHEPLVPSLPITVLRFHDGVNVGTFHATANNAYGYYYGRPFLTRYFNRLHACIAVSPAARDFVSRYFPGEYDIVPNGVDTNTFTPNVIPLADLRTPGKFTILFLGRIEHRKGLQTLLDAYVSLRNHRSDFRLVVVGEGPGRADLEDWVHMYNIPDVTFTGWVDDETKIRCFASADIFCAPATGSESFGIVLLEAMSSGIPVLASAIPGYSQVVTPGIDGLLVAPKDITQWERAIEVLADNPELRRRFSEAGRQHAITCDWSRVTDRVLEVYEEARDRAARHFVAATAASGA